MSTTINGTQSDDDFDLLDFSDSHGVDDFNVYGNGGDDSLSAFYIGRSGVDGFFGGDGDDHLAVSGYLSSGYNHIIFDGGLGTDYAYITSGHQLIGDIFRVSDNNATEFQIENVQDGTVVSVTVFDTVEFLAWDEMYYLTEDVANGRIRAADFDEVYARAYGGNADWKVKGLNTYDQYHGVIQGSSVTGTADDDELFSDPMAIVEDLIDGGAGDDVIKGYGGADVLTGGSGNDFINGHWGRDTLYGNNGDDELRGGDGGDTIYGGNGADLIWGGGHKNNLYAGSNDFAADHIFIHADVSLFGLSGDGSYADAIFELGVEDKIFIHGADNFRLSFGYATLPRDTGISGVGIYVDAVLEAVVSGGFTTGQVNAMTMGGIFT